MSSLQARGRVLGTMVLAAQNPDRFDDRAERTLRAVLPAVSAVADGAARFEQAFESV